MEELDFLLYNSDDEKRIYNESLESIYYDTLHMNKIMKHIDILVEEQGKKLDKVESNIIEAKQDVKRAETEIVTAELLNRKNLVIGAGIFGTCLISPAVGMYFGLKVGLAAGASILSSSFYASTKIN